MLFSNAVHVVLSQGVFLTGSGSVFNMLDEQNHVPGATDASFLRKINTALKKEKFYIPPKSVSHGRFSIRHYAGEASQTFRQIHGYV